MPSTHRLPTRRLPRDERISRIVAVTRKMLTEKGHEGIVTADVAERCGISEATIYKYFESKRELLVRVAEQWFEEMLREDQRSLAGRTVLDTLRQVVWRALSVVRREPALTRFVLLDLRPDPEYRHTPVFQLNREFTAQVTEVLRTGVERGELRDDVPVQILRDMVFGCIEHQTWAFLRGEGDFSVDDVAEGIVTVIYRGMRSAQPGPASPDALADAVARLERVTDRLAGAVPAPVPAKRAPKPQVRAARAS